MPAAPLSGKLFQNGFLPMIPSEIPPLLAF
jgi:hypothetical protein